MSAVGARTSHALRKALATAPGVFWLAVGNGGCGGRTDMRERDLACHDDLDGDGFISAACDGEDCDDCDPAVHPGAADPPGRREWMERQVFPTAAPEGRLSIAAGPGHSIGIAIAYSGSSGHLRTFIRDRCEWQDEQVAEQLGQMIVRPSLASAIDGTLRVAFANEEAADQGLLRYASRESGTWQDDASFSDLGIEAEGAALAVDSQGAPQLAHFRSDTLWLTTFGSGTWTPEVVTPEGGHPALALRDDGLVAIAWSRGGDHPVLWLARGRHGEWLIENVDERPRLALPSLVVAADGVVHVAYSGGESNDIRHGWSTAGGWMTEVVDSRNLGIMLVVTIGQDQEGVLHIVYLDEDRRELRHAWRRGGGWDIEVVAGAVAGWDSSFAIDDRGGLHVAFVEFGTGDLHYLRSDAPDDDCDGSDG